MRDEIAYRNRAVRFALVFVASLLATIWVPPFSGSGTAKAEPRRGGFTLELASGVGHFSSYQSNGDDVAEPALVPLSLGIGGFVSRRVALLARVSTLLFEYKPRASGARTSRLEPQTTRMLFVGSSVQLWLSDNWQAEAGVGMAALGNGPWEARINRGLAFPARLGRSFADLGPGTFSITAEVLPTIFAQGERTVGTTIGLQWQWL